jgi:hypothetical protein
LPLVERRIGIRVEDWELNQLCGIDLVLGVVAVFVFFSEEDEAEEGGEDDDGESSKNDRSKSFLW